MVNRVSRYFLKGENNINNETETLTPKQATENHNKTTAIGMVSNELLGGLYQFYVKSLS